MVNQYKTVQTATALLQNPLYPPVIMNGGDLELVNSFPHVDILLLPTLSKIPHIIAPPICAYPKLGFLSRACSYFTGRSFSPQPYTNIKFILQLSVIPRSALMVLKSLILNKTPNNQNTTKNLHSLSPQHSIAASFIFNHLYHHYCSQNILKTLFLSLYYNIILHIKLLFSKNNNPRKNLIVEP